MGVLWTKVTESLSKREVAEIAMATGRLPCAKIGAEYKPIDRGKVTMDDLLVLLRDAGAGSRLGSIGAQPVQWPTPVPGLGIVSVAAVRKGDVVQVRCVVSRREETPSETRAVAESAVVARGAPARPSVPALEELELDLGGPAPAPAPIALGPTPVAATPMVSSAPIALGPTPVASSPARRAPQAPIELDLSDEPASLDLDLDRGARPAAPAQAPPERLADVDDAPALDVEPVAPPAQPRPRATSGGEFVPAPVGVRGAVGVAAAPAAPVPAAATPAASPAAPMPAAPMRSPMGSIALTPSTSPMAFRPMAVPTPQTSGSLDAILRLAREHKASDVHIVAERPLLLRVAGDLTPFGERLDAATVESLILPLIPARLQEVFHKDGSTDFALQHPTLGRYRVNMVRQRTGLAAVMRVIPYELPTLESLGLPAAVASATRHHQGLIVITGPTGHGKTTTLTALVNLINTETTHHVITVEDPVEFVHPRKKAMMSQREVGTHTRSFRSALKGSLREDPDVIVIGELRDTETVRIALAASETGHLVIGTMNTPSAAKTIDRLIDLFPPGDQAQVRMTLAGGLKLVMSQRLVPSADRTAVHAAVELLPGSMALWNLIRDNKTFQIPSLQQRGKALGIVRLDDSLLELIRAGKTTLENAVPFADAPEDLRAKLAADAVPAPTAAPAPVKPDPAKALRGVAGALFGKKGA